MTHTIQDPEKNAEYMVSECEDVFDRLSKWEQGFIESAREYLDGGRTLSDGQLETLERIYCERVP